LGDFHHLDILFGLIIRIRYAKIGHKFGAEYHILALIQVIPQVARLRVFDSPSAFDSVLGGV
jgi:hypothetical protein